MNSIDIFPWNDNFNTGVPKIDEQHKRLVQLLNLLANHVAFQSDIPALNIIFDELADYAVYHFQTEETIWHQYFPEDPLEITHKAVHNSFVETVLKLKAEQNTKPADHIIEEVLAFLTRWLAAHILESDRYLAMIVLAMQSGLSLESAKKQAHEQMSGSTRVLIDIILAIYESLSINTLRLMRELAKRKRDEEALRHSQELMQSLLETSPIAVRITVSSDRKVAFANKRYAKLTNIAVDRVIGTDPAKYYANPQDYENILQTLNQGAAVTDRLVELSIPGTGTVWVLATYLNIEYENRPAVLGWFYDVTEIRAAEAQLHLLANNVSDLISRHDPKGNYLYVTPSCQSLMGWREEELLGRSCYEFFHADDIPLIQTAHRQILEQTETSMLSYRLQRKDSSFVWVESTVRATRDTDNNVVDIIAATRDISERKRAEDELRKLSLAVEQSPSSIVITDLDANIEFINDAFVKTTGYNPAEVIGFNPRILQSGKTPKKTHLDMWGKLMHGDVWQGEFINKRKDGSEYTEWAIISPVNQPDGSVSHYLAIKEDITERKRLERHLVDQLVFTQAVIDAEVDGIAVCHSINEPPNVRFTVWNQSMETLTGYNIEEINHLGWYQTVYIDPEIQELARQRMDRMRQGEHLHGEEWTITRKDGAQRVVQIYTSICANGAEDVHILAVMHDITKRKYAETALRESHQQMYSLLNSMAEGTYGVDTNGHCRFVNQSFLRILGYEQADEIIGKHIHELIHYAHPDGSVYPATECQIYAAYLRNEPIHVTDEVFWRKNGTPVPVEYWSQPIMTDGVVTGAITTFVDISERKQAEQQLRIAATVFESQQGMMVTDASNAILRVNKAFTDITGYAAEDVIGKNPHILQSGRHNQDFYKSMWESIHNTGTWEGEVWNRRKSGEIYPQYLTITAVKDQNQTITHYVSTLTDITLKKAAAEEIERLAFYDPLTGLPNRRLLQNRLKPALASSHRNGRKGALLFIDLDNFKTLNDTLGHDMGDLLLQQVAKRLSACVREGDTVARLGGDEFVVMLEDLSEQAFEAAKQTETIGNKILAIMNQPFQLAAHDYLSTPSIGATLFSGRKQSAEELLKHADIAMYQAKMAGRNTLRFFDPQMQNAITTRVSLENELRKALVNRQFQLYYQIQMESPHHPLGAEALIRWQHPERGLIPPAEFIPLAEETGLIIPIGQWVLETACAQLKAWQQEPLTRDLVLSINVSAKQFFQSDFAEQVQTAIQQYAINPAKLKLELTESLLLKNIEDTIDTMNALRKAGIQFSLDDFGTGYSSLQYLKKLPLYQLKIDQSFVRDIASDDGDRVIVRTIIAMATSLNLGVIAEGVETEEQRQLLLNNGCTHYQGYLFSKPVPIEAFYALLEQARKLFVQ